MLIDMANELEALAESTGSTLNAVTDAVESYVTGIPAPMRKGAMKAFGQLLSAAIELPLATIQGAVDEKKAESKARIQIIEAQAKRIAEQTNVDPAFVEAASVKFAKKIIREQVNLDKIVEVASDQLKHGKNETNDAVEPEKEIEPDWLNSFESLARNMSSEQMQALFGKILSGEIKRPSTYSIKTLNILAQLDNKAANTFRTLASLTMIIGFEPQDIIIDARVIGLGNAGQNTLTNYGLSFDKLNILQENGLIISDYNSYMDYSCALLIDKTINIPLKLGSKLFAIEHKDQNNKSRQNFNVHGVGLTNAGRELIGVVEHIEVPGYFIALCQFFDQQGYILRQLA